MDSIEPMTFPRLLLAVIVGAVLAAGCTTGGGETPSAAPTEGETSGPTEAPGTPGEEGMNQSPLRSPPAGVDAPPEDRDATSSGDAPDYAEMVAATVEADAASVTFTVTFEDSLPRRMPDRYTNMRVSITVLTPAKESTQFIDQGGASGWLSFTQGEGGDEEFPGELSIDGSRMTMTLPRDAIPPPRFSWLATSAWDASPPGSHSYSFDLYPNEGFEDHPA